MRFTITHTRGTLTATPIAFHASAPHRSLAMLHDDLRAEETYPQTHTVIVDLATYDWLNSLGLGIVVGLHCTCAREGKSLRLVVNDRIARLLEVTRLDGSLRTFPTLADAQTHIPRRRF